MYIGQRVSGEEQIALHEHLHNWLKEYEVNEQRPVALFDGGFNSAYRVPDWTQEIVDAVNADSEQSFTVDQANERGIRLASWCGHSNAVPRTWGEIPGTFYRDATPRDLLYADILRPGQDGLAEPLVVTHEGNGEEFPYGEVLDRQIYYFVNLEGGFNDPEQLDPNVLFGRAFERSIDMGPEIERRQQEAAMRLFVSDMQQSRDGLIENRRRDLTSYEQQIRSYQNSMQEQITAARNTQREIDSLERTDSLSEEDLRAQWEAIQRHAYVVNVDYRNGRMTIDTKALAMEHPDTGERVGIGHFRIEMDPSSGHVHLRNQDGGRRGRDHPHVQEGEACWGNIGSQITRYVSDRNYSSAFELIIPYLQSFNPQDDWGRYAAWFYQEPILDYVPED